MRPKPSAKDERAEGEPCAKSSSGDADGVTIDDD
jgi:hypothetical protein